MRLYNKDNRRIYINASERERFIEAANLEDQAIRSFCLTLLFTGCRLSEVRELTQYSFQLQERLVAVRSLKKRNQHHVREIPVPPQLLEILPNSEAGFLWSSDDGKMIDRITAYRWVKLVMRKANISGPQACPKGLRHGYGIHAVRSGIQLNMLQKWMGHASIKITAIYANAVGTEEMELAEKMWSSPSQIIRKNNS